MTDDLTYMLSAYFHEDWFHIYETWQQAIDDFLTDNPARVSQVPADIQAILVETPDDVELERTLDRMGLAYDPDQGARDWLEAVRDRILAHLSGTHPSDADDQGCAP